MHFRTATTVAILACVAHVSARAEAQLQPYLAVRSIPGLSLMRRQSNGYEPQQDQCGSGDTCAEACGAGYSQCASSDNIAHCFDTSAGESCCTDGTGNSCDAGYYCTHDTALQTLCCPDSMDLAACAAAYSVAGSLVPATASPTPSTSATPSATPTTTAVPTATAAPTTTAAAPTTAAPMTLAPATSGTATEKQDKTSAVTSSQSHTTAVSGGFNNTVSSPVRPSGAVASISPGAPQPSSPSTISDAATSSVSALLLLAAGVIALL